MFHWVTISDLKSTKNRKARSLPFYWLLSEKYFTPIWRTINFDEKLLIALFLGVPIADLKLLNITRLEASYPFSFLSVANFPIMIWHQLRWIFLITLLLGVTISDLKSVNNHKDRKVHTQWLVNSKCFTLILRNTNCNEKLFKIAPLSNNQWLKVC